MEALIHVCRGKTCEWITNHYHPRGSRIGKYPPYPLDAITFPAPPLDAILRTINVVIIAKHLAKYCQPLRASVLGN